MKYQIPKNKKAARLRVLILKNKIECAPWWKFHTIYTAASEITQICAYHGFSE